MTVITHDPIALAARAQSLRRLANQLTECALDGLAQRAGPDTWLGPSADRCRDELAAHVQAVATAIDDLRARARRLDNQALAASPVRGVI